MEKKNRKTLDINDLEQVDGGLLPPLSYEPIGEPNPELPERPKLIKIRRSDNK